MRIIFFINDLVAKILSKIIYGAFGTLVHFFVIGFINSTIISFFSPYIYSLYAVYFLGIDESSLVFDKDFSSNPYEMLKEPVYKHFIIFMFVLGIFLFVYQIVGTIRSSEIYSKAKEKKRRKKFKTFGESRFSDNEEVVKAGLTGKGIVFGKINNKLIVKPPEKEGHTIVIGGTGTGKTRGVIIPTLFNWEGSALIVDIKGELSKITEAKRSLYGKTYIFNPEDEKHCDCYDPIKYASTIDEAQDLARTLIPVPQGADPIWSQSAQALLSAFVFEGSKKGYKLSDIAEKLCVTPVGELVEYCRKSGFREVRILASITYDMPEKTLGGVMAELKSKLITIATDENIRMCTSKSDWTPEILEDGATIYLRVSEHLLEQYRDIWTLIINQTLKYLSKRNERKNPPILIALDEMPRLSKLNNLISALATLRSRNVHILSVVQSMAQLDMIYGKDARKVIADNCLYKFVLSATDPETQKYFSDLAGNQTIFSSGYSTGSSFLPNHSQTEQGVELIRPEKWAKLDKPILFAPKLFPIELDFAFWDKENF